MSSAVLVALLVLAQAPVPDAAAAPTAAPRLTRAPELLSSVPPIYPEGARKERRGGTVGLRVTLDIEGAVSRVDVVESAGPDLDWAALGALTQFVFSPAEIDGRPATVAIGYRLAFEVPRGPSTSAPETDTGEDAGEGGTGARAESRATFTLAGRVRRAGTVAPLPFAEVSVSELLPGDRLGPPRALESDDEGRFAFPPLPEGPYRLEVGREGYEPFIDEQYFAPGARHDLDVALVPRQANELETVVRRQRGEPPVSRVSLSREEVTAIPGTYGDALRVLESLPGVARAPFLGGSLMVRGGYPADTVVHFEGVPIPILYHFGGFTSVINGAFIEEISFLPGGFPVRYGNATAGVVDVRAHELDDETFHTHFDVDLFDFGFVFGGRVRPLADQPALKVGFAARRSHAEIPASLALAGAQAFQVPLSFLPVPLYYDYQLKLESELTSTSTASLFVFGGEDSWAVLGEPAPLGAGPDGEELDLAEVLNTFLGSRFHRVLGSWELRPGPGVTNTLRPWVGTTRRGLLSDGVVVPLLTNSSLDTPTDELSWGVRDELAVRFAPWLRGLAGFEHHGAAWDVTLAGAPFGEGEPLAPDATAEPAATTARAGLSTAAVYGELQVGPMAGLSVTPGVRVELSSMSFDEAQGNPVYGGARPTSRSVVDAWTVDPRVSLRYTMTPSLVWKAAGGTFHRRPRAQSAASDVDGDELLSPGALQVIGGFEALLIDGLTLDAQVYGVKRYDLTRERARLYVPGRAPFSVPLSGLGSYDSFGSGNTLGFELFLRVPPTKRFFGWIAYTFSRTEVSLGDQREARVPFAFDQTHNLVAVGKVTLPWNLTLGGRFAFVTGNPGPLGDSITTRHDLNNNSYGPVISSLRPSRLPPYHRLDLRIDKRFVSDWWSAVAYLEVINVYNWPNAELVFPGGDYRFREVRTLLPNFPLLPLVGVELDL